MAEALLNSLGAGRFRAYSAGSQPGGAVNPFAIERVQFLDYPLENLRSKSWDEYAVPGAPQMECIITVCESAAGDACSMGPCQPTSAHCGIERSEERSVGKEIGSTCWSRWERYHKKNKLAHTQR